MKLSTKARYGLRAMLALAQFPGGATGKAIAENQALPAAYLEQLLSRLRNAKLVSAQRGAKGKFALTRPPEQINLAEIITALEGPLDIANCESVTSCSSEPDLCVFREIFDKSNQILQDYWASLSLAELVERQKSRSQACPADYSI